MSVCVVCHRFVDSSRIKKLRNTTPNLMNCLLDLITFDSRLKTTKLENDEACLSCFRELSSLFEYQEIVQKKQNEIMKRIKSDSFKYYQKSLLITKTVIPHPEHDNQNHIPSRSIISMDAEITITEEENGETAIDLEIVEGISDLRRPNGFFGCRFCKREFSAPNYAIKHMQDMHGKLLHKCDVCSKEFRQKAEVDKHRATHLRDEPLPYPCSSCPQSFKTFEEFQDHSRTHQMMKKFGCAQCGRRFKDEAKLHKHMINHNTNPYSCQRCKKTFRSKHTYLKHRKMHGDNQKFTCDLCNKHFSSAESLHMHLKNHRTPYR